MANCKICNEDKELVSTEYFVINIKGIKMHEEIFSRICKKCGNLKYGYSKPVDRRVAE